MKNTGLQYGFDIDAMLSESIIYQYVNMELNNKYNSPFINGKIPP